MVIAVVEAKSSVSIESPHKSTLQKKGPGPGKYLLPGTTGAYNHDPTRSRSPAYSMGVKHAHFSTIRTTAESGSPGPVYFVAPCMTRKGRYVSPAFSMRGKSKEIPPSVSPGPAAYSTEKVPPPHSPAYPFGLHTNAGARSQTPGPNAYILPHLIGAATQVKPTSPAFSMPGRRMAGSFHDDLHQTPGPAAYNVVDITVTQARSPSCVIGARHYGPIDRTRTPGPATYQAEQVTVGHRDAPAYSFGLRHSEFITPVLDMVV